MFPSRMATPRNSATKYSVSAASFSKHFPKALAREEMENDTYLLVCGDIRYSETNSKKKRMVNDPKAHFQGELSAIELKRIL